MSAACIQARLAARFSQSPEDILPARLEPGTGSAQRLQERVFPSGVPASAQLAAARAVGWACAANRAGFPAVPRESWPAWQRDALDKGPVIVTHPLTGAMLNVRGIAGLDAQEVRSVAAAHLLSLVHGPADGVDLHRTALALWRFAPELRGGQLARIWPLLPADPRVPDHTLWDQFDLTAAFAGAFVAEDVPALLAVSIGPVQDFIAAARSTSDLWAGSHLLSRLAWEAMQVVCERCGPEAIVFPRLRGVPLVDCWLRDQQGLRPDLFTHLVWTRDRTDTNPLFAAALPNRFTAIVPAASAKAIAAAIEARLRTWVREQAECAYRRLLEVAAIEDAPTLPGYRQIAEQLRGFPEVHWAAVPWSLAEMDEEGLLASQQDRLAAAMQPFFGDSQPSYFGTETWQSIAGGFDIGSGEWRRPEPGALYPVLQDLLERLLAAAKAVRPFEQTTQSGWRCSLTGETEWITTDRRQLETSYRQQADTLWAHVARRQPAWAKPGEHLGALPMLKRLWPTLFVREVRDTVDAEVQRYVVSTHGMAAAGTLVRWLATGEPLPEGFRRTLDASNANRVAMPRRLARHLRSKESGMTLLRLPGWLEDAQEAGTGGTARRQVTAALGAPPETYYGLLLLDGDRLGAWLGAEPALAPTRAATAHPRIREALAGSAGDHRWQRWAGACGAATPAWHMTIADILNRFALDVAPACIEDLYHGRLLYAGGDDVLALLPAAELLPAAAALREGYRGSKGEGALADAGFECPVSGFLGGRDGYAPLGRAMGERATVSCGLVIAHHQAPFAAILRELRAAERRAKDEGGRDAWSLALVKRSGGTVHLTARWGDPVAAFVMLRDFLASPDVSSRAAYNTLEWLHDVPDDQDLVTGLLTRQLRRQAGSAARDAVSGLARRLAAVAFSPELRPSLTPPREWLRDCLVAAEFLARETRMPRECSQLPAAGP